jgi:hypothetical protein
MLAPMPMANWASANYQELGKIWKIPNEIWSLDTYRQLMRTQ